MDRISELPTDAAELEDNFGLFDQWEDRYTYLVDLGKRLPAMSDVEKTEENKVRGCTSQVWFVQRDARDGRLWWDGDSDAAIVRGLIAILQVLYNGKSPDEVRATDVDAVFGRLGLEKHLTINRRNGFFAMVGRLKAWSG